MQCPGSNQVALLVCETGTNQPVVVEINGTDLARTLTLTQTGLTNGYYYVGLWLAHRDARRRGLDPESLFKAAELALLGGLVGARLYYVAFNLDYYARVPAKIFVPSISSPAKVQRIRGYGADLVVGGDRYDDARAACEAWVATSGATDHSTPSGVCLGPITMIVSGNFKRRSTLAAMRPE